MPVSKSHRSLEETAGGERREAAWADPIEAFYLLEPSGIPEIQPRSLTPAMTAAMVSEQRRIQTQRRDMKLQEPTCGDRLRCVRVEF